MRIKGHQLPIKDLEIGERFCFDGKSNVYIRTDRETSDGTILCVHLKTGETKLFLRFAPVERVDQECDGMKIKKHRAIPLKEVECGEIFRYTALTDDPMLRTETVVFATHTTDKFTRCFSIVDGRDYTLLLETNVIPIDAEVVIYRRMKKED